MRLRRVGSTWLQTIKGGGVVQAGLHRRWEYEAPVAGPKLELDGITDATLARVFASRRLRERLRPVFATRISRSVRLIELAPGTTVEASIDRGEIRAGGQSEPVREIELELKSGDAARLYEHGLRLLAVAPVRVENRSKAERGYALARPQQSKPVKSTRVAIVATMRVGEAFRAIASGALGQLQANEPGMRAGHDPEYLHQMRVALRRLRSGFRVFAPALPEAASAPIVEDLRWLARALGPARDWNVFTSETMPSVVAAFAGHAGVAQFAEGCARKEREAVRRARRAVGSVRYQRMLLRLGVWLTREAWRDAAEPSMLQRLDGTVTEFAVAVLDECHAAVTKRARHLERQSAAQLHRLRIAIKKLRYSMDFFGALFPPGEVSSTLSCLESLQDVLGAMNDGATAGQLAREVLGEGQGQVTSEAYGIVIGWGRGRAATLRDQLSKAWRAYRDCGRCWRS